MKSEADTSPPPGRHLLFDCETNGLMPQVNRVHCLGFADVHSGELFTFTEETMEEGLRQLYEADVLSGHNIIAYDLKVLAKVYGWHPRPGTRLIDTLILARQKHPDIKMQDIDRGEKFRELGGKVGAHRLKDWGIRLGEHKAEYQGGWEICTPEMIDYMMQDVKTNVRLLQYLKPEEYPRAPLLLATRATEVCALIEEAGWPFNERKGGELYTKLCARRDEIERELVAQFGSWEEVDRVVIPKRPNKARGYQVGVPVTHMKTVVFNPGSRVHIEKKLRELGWEPEETTETGRAKLDEDSLLKVDLPGAKLLVEYLVLQKRLGQLGDGENAWLKVVASDGRVHTKYNVNGTVTGRATHSNPNISQVPSVRAPYGRECRELFGVPKGWKLIDADQQGLELRCLAHYLAYFDKGAYAKTVVEGDVHTLNQQAMGLPTRDLAKTVCYATLYGAGDEKIGKTVGGGSKQGRTIKENWKNNVPGLKSLMDATVTACAKGYLKGLDGRQVPIRHKHAALNTLLQSAGAVICWQWLVDTYDQLSSKFGYGWDKDFVIIGFIHDAINVACRAEIAQEVGETIVACAKAAGAPYNFRCQLDSSFHIGDNWAEVH